MDIRKLVSDNMPVILTSTAVAGLLSTTVLAVKATPNALRDIWDAQSEHDREITKVEMVKLTYQYYIPAAIMGGATIAAIIGAHSVHTKRQAAIASLYTLTDRAYSEYKEKVAERIGEKKEKEIHDEVVQDRVTKTGDESSQVVIFDESKVLCYDNYTGVFFESSKEILARAQNEVNAECINNSYASQNEFYKRVGLPVTPFGEEVGWRPDTMLDLIFSSGITEDGRPYLAIDYRTNPIRGYYRGH